MNTFNSPETDINGQLDALLACTKARVDYLDFADLVYTLHQHGVRSRLEALSELALSNTPDGMSAIQVEEAVRATMNELTDVDSHSILADVVRRQVVDALEPRGDTFFQSLRLMKKIEDGRVNITALDDLAVTTYGSLSDVSKVGKDIGTKVSLEKDDSVSGVVSGENNLYYSSSNPINRDQHAGALVLSDVTTDTFETSLFSRKKRYYIGEVPVGEFLRVPIVGQDLFTRIVSIEMNE